MYQSDGYWPPLASLIWSQVAFHSSEDREARRAWISVCVRFDIAENKMWAMVLYPVALNSCSIPNDACHPLFSAHRRKRAPVAVLPSPILPSTQSVNSVSREHQRASKGVELGQTTTTTGSYLINYHHNTIKEHHNSGATPDTSPIDQKIERRLP